MKRTLLTVMRSLTNGNLTASGPAAPGIMPGPVPWSAVLAGMQIKTKPVATLFVHYLIANVDIFLDKITFWHPVGRQSTKHCNDRYTYKNIHRRCPGNHCRADLGHASFNGCGR